MNDLALVWFRRTGELATSVVNLEYEVEITGGGCCEMCYSESAGVTFWLVSGGKSVIVYDYDLGLTER